MTDQAPFKTMGFCATCQRHTRHVCAKCQPAAPEGQPTAIAARTCPDARDAEIVRLERENARLRKDYGEVCDNLQNVIHEFGGGNAGSNLDEVVIEMLRTAKSELATALETMHTVQDARNDFARRLTQIAHFADVQGDESYIELVGLMDAIYPLANGDGS